jgi:hypothetical protein
MQHIQKGFDFTLKKTFHCYKMIRDRMSKTVTRTFFGKHLRQGNI